jgi:hypothetical protein
VVLAVLLPLKLSTVLLLFEPFELFEPVVEFEFG